MSVDGRQTDQMSKMEEEDFHETTTYEHDSSGDCFGFLGHRRLIC
jgi:hypothetical protein